MTNRIDFYQSEQASLALPAASVMTFLDGALCGFLEPLEIVRAGYPTFSYAKLRYNPSAYLCDVLVPPEDIETILPMGKSVSLLVIYSNAAGGVKLLDCSLFAGSIEGIETKLSGDGQETIISARDFSSALKRITVYGQRIADSDSSNIFMPGFETVFNPDGKPNASLSLANVNGKAYTTFHPTPGSGRLWSYANIIDYLLNEYLPAGQLELMNLTRLKTLTDNIKARDLDLTGLNLLDALHRCCERIGLCFKFVPLSQANSPDQAIVFYKTFSGRTIELNRQQNGEKISISKTNIATLKSNRNFWPVTHKYIGQGDYKIYEATFELVKAWDTSLESDHYDTFCPSTNPDFYKFKDVYRKWALNEAGDYSGTPYNSGDLFDFSRIFQGADYLKKRRRFHPAITADSRGISLGYYLEVSYDSGDTWWQYLSSFNNLTGECGVWLSGQRLDMDIWAAAINDTLKFRITASVISDERLTAVVADGPLNSVVPVIEHVFTLPRQFKYRKISDQSIFSANKDESLITANQLDDTNALYEYVRLLAATSPEQIEKSEVETPFLEFDYQVGDIVSAAPESRDILACRSDNRSKNRIVKVKMDFQNQSTKLNIIRNRLL